MRALRLFQDVAGGRSVPNILHQGWDLSVLKVPGSAGGALGAPWWQDQSWLPETFPPGTRRVSAEPQPSSPDCQSPPHQQWDTAFPPSRETLLIFPWLFLPQLETSSPREVWADSSALSLLQDNLDLTKVAVMGHSFGGVTAVLALVKEPSFR